MRTLLVTGGGGFLAYYFATEFREAGWRVLGLGRGRPAQPEIFDGDFWEVRLPSLELRDYFQRVRPDLIINTVGTSSIAFSMEQPSVDLEQNVLDFHHLLDQLRLSGCGARVLQLSSAAVYGQPDVFPITEATPLRPVSPYGFHKWQAELAAREFHEIYGLAVCNLRIFSAYGAGLRRQVIWELCRKAHETGCLTLEGTGLEERDFFHGRDVARAARLIAENGRFDGGAYNLAEGVSRRIDEVARCIGEIAGLKDEPTFAGLSRPGNPAIWRVQPTRLQELGFSSKVAWESGLKENVEWCLKQLGA